MTREQRLALTDWYFPRDRRAVRRDRLHIRSFWSAMGVAFAMHGQEMTTAIAGPVGRLP